MAEEKKQAEALTLLGEAMKRWGIKPEQLKSPWRELMSFQPDEVPAAVVANISLGDLCPRCGDRVDAIETNYAAGTGVVFRHHQRDGSTSCVFPPEPKP